VEWVREKRLSKQETLGKHAERKKEQIVVYVDTREQNSAIASKLEEIGVDVREKMLEVGDYVLSDGIVAERKTIGDFLQSIVDGRLFEQLATMKSNFEKPLLLVEGDLQRIYSLRNIHRNSIVGALTSAALNYGVPILFTSCPRETVEFLYNIAKREQLGKANDIRLRVGRKGATLAEQQRFVVESLPFVGPKMARALLKKFKTIRNIANAYSRELQTVENLGKKKAKHIKRVFRAEYAEE
jgi:Fanconi anemia group M protein